MNIKQVKEELRHTIQAYTKKNEFGEYEIPFVRQRPMLIIGPPGIGKTAIMSQVARECHVALVSYTITHHTRQSAIGLPFIEKKNYGGREYNITEYTMSEIVASIYDKMEETGMKEGILFIDEINCVSETLAPTMLQFLQGKTFGNHRIPEGWVIVSAGNPPEYNQSVREFDIVTLDRVRRIDVEPDFSVWKSYAYDNNIHGAIISYLDIKKENFYSVETTVDGKQIVTARGWEDLSELMHLYEELNIPVTEDVISQYIQNPRIAKDFANYFDLYKKYRTDYDVDAVVEGRIKEVSIGRIQKASFDEKLSVINLLVSKLVAVFRETFGYDRYVRDLYECMKELKFVMGRKDSGRSSAEIIGEKIDQAQAQLKLAQKQGLYDEEQLRSSRLVIRTLERYRCDVLDQKMDDPAAAFEYIKGQFAADTKTRQEMIVHAKQCLENAFAFMETAFGESQEMVIFITQLNASAICLRFIRENGSEKYDKYNRSLLFNEKREELLKDIDETMRFADVLK